jgi:hypothetical protein
MAKPAKPAARALCWRKLRRLNRFCFGVRGIINFFRLFYRQLPAASHSGSGLSSLHTCPGQGLNTIGCQIVEHSSWPDRPPPVPPPMPGRTARLHAQIPGGWTDCCWLANSSLLIRKDFECPVNFSERELLTKVKELSMVTPGAASSVLPNPKRILLSGWLKQAGGLSSGPRWKTGRRRTAGRQNNVCFLSTKRYVDCV